MTTGNSRPRRRLRRGNTPKALRQERQSSMTSDYENREDKADGWRVPRLHVVAPTNPRRRKVL